MPRKSRLERTLERTADDVKNGRVTVTRFVCLAISRAYDGRLRITSPDVPGLVLSSKNEDGLWRDLGPAMQKIMSHNEAK